jgi:hypothetical protein
LQSEFAGSSSDRRTRAVRNGIIGVLLALGLAALVWSSDQITLQGERTIYAVACERGTWSGNRCDTALAPAERHAFRASRTRQEVLYWIRGSKQPIKRYADCEVENRDNWTCRVHADQRPPPLDGLINGRPASTPADPTTGVRLHAVPKWKWYAMRLGLRVFADADY